MMKAVHWDFLEGQTLVAIETGLAQFVVWPAPVQHDACLAEAGFECFDDDAGDDVSPLALRLMRCLSVLGEARVRDGERWATQKPVSWWRRLQGRTSVRRTPAETLADSADDDNFPPCVVDFINANNVTAATILSSDGHPLFWIGILPGCGLSIDDLVNGIAAGLSTHRTPLRWDVLMPRPLMAPAPR